MDHLLRPQDGVDIGVRVPYVCDDQSPDDCSNFRLFPSIRGYKLDRHGMLSFVELQSRQKPRAASFVQEWLFFGLLRVYFDRDYYRRNDYIMALPGSRTRVVHTQNLAKALGIKQKELRAMQRGKLIDTACEQDRLHALLYHAAQCCAELDNWLNPDRLDPAWPIVLFSVKLLIQTLDVDSWLDKRLHMPPNRTVPSLSPLYDAMLRERGWCVHQVQELSSANTYHALFYLASLRRYPGPWVDHKKCQHQDQCVAYNVDERTFETLHATKDCKCLPILAPSTNLSIIDSGNIPFVKCTRKPNHPPTLSHGVVFPGTKYIAISHIWSDGLGNIRENGLPRCQLERIVDLVEVAEKEVEERTLNPFVLAVQRQLQSIRCYLFGKPTAQVNFWMDVLCNPVVPPGSDSAQSQYIERIKATAISRLMPTYIFSRAVLILDYEVQQATLAQGKPELLSRLAVSGWKTRCWTHQEYCFSRRPMYQCADGIGPWVSRSSSVPGVGTTMTDDVWRELQNLSGAALEPTPHVRDPLRAVIGVGYTSGSPDDLETQREARFVHIWNDLSRKNITHSQDSIKILANLLEFRAGDLIGLSMKDQMKAILGSHQRLPIDLLFTSTRRHLDTVEDRWIPLFPKGGAPLRENAAKVGVTPSGLLIRSSLFRNAKSALTAVEVRSASWGTWDLHIPNAHAELDQHLWVSTRVVDGDDHIPVPDGSHFILILDASSPVLVGTTGRPRAGFCLAVKDLCLQQGVIQTHYVTPVHYGNFVPGSTVRPNDAHQCEGTQLDPSSPDILIVSSIADWDHLECRRNLRMPAEFHLRATLTLHLALNIAAVCTWILLYKLWIAATSNASPRWYYIASGIFLLEGISYLMVRWLASTYTRRANDYLQLQSFQDDWIPEEPPQKRLCKALDKLDTSAMPWQSRAIVVILEWLVWICR